MWKLKDRLEGSRVVACLKNLVPAAKGPLSDLDLNFPIYLDQNPTNMLERSSIVVQL